MPIEDREVKLDPPSHTLSGRNRAGQGGEHKGRRRTGPMGPNKSWCAVCGRRFPPGGQMVRCRTCRRWVHGETEAKEAQPCSSPDQLYCLACQANGWAEWDEDGDGRTRRCGNAVWCHHGLALAPSHYCSEECGIQAAELRLDEEEEAKARGQSQSASPSTADVKDVDVLHALNDEESKRWALLQDEVEELTMQRREWEARSSILASSFQSIPSGQCGFPSALIHPLEEIPPLDASADTSLCQAIATRCLLHRRWPLVWEELLRKQRIDLEREEEMAEKEKSQVLLEARQRMDRAALLARDPQALASAGQTIRASPTHL
ncbi:hypothetical protein BJ684DRAFT_17672 [Piptocephalis cylindrospora]|uniref:Zinc finger PHD-type domain-containing protein n=1 Tax=Piptocephalis cylindrospora TaxID=1907219 RepID=A0A4P9XZA8_9FUNG|nr:hypothetical protein BJ684DRAFT_17672 [Piptocephalis cylindrospora]|eukprot:RKP11765.1 hypothetical protein BJ684DRAFT_17672 [Piptocephalis cylindrospora]